ncbi:hypothetical protein M422DRAFT_38041 [Sphaerobolus stellatus SS14]|uniref:KN homeodomain domain-containing protein n=1 Tax=Sphaerobolus stellatus (strain SS14) TaxID=990650 RepID=A0A0C9TYK9_SPHS4|nr:hypothetical protein M422DRAFT_38041 [Sphaerobolus stellatus SS14]
MPSKASLQFPRYPSTQPPASGFPLPSQYPSSISNSLPSGSSSVPLLPLAFPLASKSESSPSPSPNPTPKPPRKPPPNSHTRPISSIARHCYPFFLKHLHHPFPTREDKEAIVANANKFDSETITLTRVSNWFMNARRRSGYLEICNESFGGDSQRMGEFCVRVFEVPEGFLLTENPRAEERIREMRTKVLGWQESQEVPSDWARELSAVLQTYTEFDRLLIDSAFKHITSIAPGKTFDELKVIASTLPLKENSHTAQGHLFSGSLLSTESLPVAGSKRKRSFSVPESDDTAAPSLRHSSSSSSLFSTASECSFASSRTPSFTWSDTSDDTPINKRTRLDDESVQGVDFNSLSSRESVQPPAHQSFSADSEFTFSVPWPVMNEDPFFLPFTEENADLAPALGSKRPLETEVGDSPESEITTSQTSTKRRRVESLPSTNIPSNEFPSSTPVQSFQDTMPLAMDFTEQSILTGESLLVAPPTQGDLDVSVFDWSSFLEGSIAPLSSDFPEDLTSLLQLANEIETADPQRGESTNFQQSDVVGSAESGIFPEEEILSFDLDTLFIDYDASDGMNWNLSSCGTTLEDLVVPEPESEFPLEQQGTSDGDGNEEQALNNRINMTIPAALRPVTL